MINSMAYQMSLNSLNASFHALWQSDSFWQFSQRIWN